MTPTRAVPMRLAALLAATALATTACGGGSSSTTAAPTSPSSSTTSAAPTDPSSSSVPASTPTLADDEQLIRVTAYGVGFALPKGWTTLDAGHVLRADNPALQSFAQRLGTSAQQVVSLLKSNVQTLSVSDEGAHDGFVDNVNSIGGTAASINDDQIKLQLATIAAKVGPIVHARSAAGKVTRVPYHWTSNGRVIQAQLIIVDLGRQLVSITISSSSAAGAAEIGDQVQRSLQRL
jgi:hypothetical protein